MTSMTGYAYKEISSGETTVSVEIRSVNSRFLDLSINVPAFLNPLESYFREKITAKVLRGKIDVTIRIKELESNAEIYGDTKIAASYYNAIKNVADAIGYKEQIPLSLIINQPNVLTLNKVYDLDSYKTLIDPVFNQALKDFISDREREGKNLEIDILKKIAILKDCAAFIKEWQPKMEESFKNQITKKFNELVADHVDQNRIMTEVAAMLVKYTINEEIVRLFSHLDAMENEILNNPTPGKRLDFICQEANREINTIGSKNQFAEISEKVVSAKDALENIREQSKNIE